MELNSTLKIQNGLGLHARAAAKIVELSNHFQSELFLGKNNHEVDGKSILSILTLSCPKGTEVSVRIVGEDAEDFLKALNRLFDQKFGEKE